MENITLVIDLNRYPLLKNQSNITEILKNLIDIGYDTKYSSTVIPVITAEPLSMESAVYNQISLLNKKHEKTDYSLSELNLTLHKLISISSNSTKKGGFAECILENTFKNRYGDIRYEATNQSAHSADAWLHLPDEQIIMLESKNYTNIVAKKELAKFENDMITHNIHWGILISYNSGVSGLRDLDYHIFSHNKKTYTIFVISNIQNVDDFHRLLDLGLQLIRRQMQIVKENISIDYVVEDITNAITELNKLISKNNILRDAFYNMEKSIHKSTYEYLHILRDYQYEIEELIMNVIKKVDIVKYDTKASIIEGINCLPNQSKEEISLITSRIIDVCYKNNCEVSKSDNNDPISKINIINKKTESQIGTIKIQTKKIIVFLTQNDLEISFCIGKESTIVKNLEILHNYL